MLSCFISCKNDTKSTVQKGESIEKIKLLLGKWETTTFLNKEQYKKALEVDFEEGVSGEMTVEYEYHFTDGNQYKLQGEIAFILQQDKGVALPLHFTVDESGTWKLHNEIIVTTGKDFKMEALDVITKSVVENMPEIKEMIQPNKKETTSLNIIKLTEGELQVKDESFSGSTFTYAKKE